MDTDEKLTKKVSFGNERTGKVKYSQIFNG